MGCQVSQNFLEQLIDQVTKPGRYIGNCLNFPKKAEGKIGFLICFPDLFEIGMSNLGIRILYHVLNRHPLVIADFAFAPWVDMESFMRHHRIPLKGMATGKNANQFDVIGFSLQHELQYTNVLTMLDLAGIPLLAEQRMDSDPIVIAGGPCTFNPQPMADFIDAFVIGDGESAVVEIATLVGESRCQAKRRIEILEKLSELEGVYVPRVGGVSKVARRIETSLQRQDYPMPPIVPVFPITHDRLTMEIMRGCTRGCRFCSAGMVARPPRIRSVRDIVELTVEGIDQSGWDEVSLISLSSSDYPRIDLLVKELAKALDGRYVSISLPSLRPGTFNREIADLISGTRRSGLTFAPEAGSERLRNLINKPVADEDLFSSIEIAYRAGWDSVKLYFMVGLPDENTEDINAIIKLIRAVQSIARGYGKRKHLTVSISPFVPRAHTPFQWEEYNHPDRVLERIRLIRKGVGEERVKVKWRDPYMALLESLLARGDRSVGKAILEAWLRGSRFESWTDQFDFSLWRSAFADVGVDIVSVKWEKGFDDQLPWDNIDAGVSKLFLIEEAKRSRDYMTTEDCRTAGCSGCGACGGQISFESRDLFEVSGTLKTATRRKPSQNMIRFRVRYQKGETMLVSSHLDVVRAIHKALRRSRMPIVFSEGFNPHPKVTFGPPLPLGIASQCEYFDVYLWEDAPPDWIERINRCLPDGLRVLAGWKVDPGQASLTDKVAAIRYRVEIVPESCPDWETRVARAKRCIEESPRTIQIEEIQSENGIAFDIISDVRQGGMSAEKVLRNALKAGNIKGRVVRVEVLWAK